MAKISQERMTCMEVWGGNRSTWSHFVVPGLDFWVYSQPFEGDEQGGDVYYVSSCASGRITRLLVGDVSGHGSEAAGLSTKLRDMMRRNVNYIDQSRLVNNLNEQFEQEATVGRFATAIVGTYFSPTRRLSVCTAGHPPPLIFDSSSANWAPLTPGGSDNDNQANIPLGIMDKQSFQSTSLKLKPGDAILAYTDSLFEATAKDGGLLQAAGIADIANSIDMNAPGDFVTELLDSIRAINPDNLANDDTTVIFATANTQGTTIKDNLLAPFRLLRGMFR